MFGTSVRVDVHYHHGRKLGTVKSRLDIKMLMETQFADDMALYTWTRSEFDPAARKEACL